MDTNIGEEYRQIDRFIEVQQDETNKRHGSLGAYRDRAHAKIARLRKWALKFPYVTPLPHEGRESWPGLSEQGSAKDKWILCRLFSRDADLGRHAGRA